MINDWTSPDGRRAIERMGWPERITFTDHLQMTFADEQWCAYGFTETIILALLRDKAREYREARGVYVRPLTAREINVYGVPPSTGWAAFNTLNELVAYGDNIDLTDIAAVLEVGHD